jgi:RNA-directed DNA polymerase
MTLEAPSMRLADALRTPSFWERVLARCEERLPEESQDPDTDWLSAKRARFTVFRGLVDSGEMLEVAEAVARREYQPAVPTQAMINKGRSGRKRVIYVFPPRDDLLFKAVNRYLQDVAAGEISPVCHSFQPGKGAKTAFQALLEDPTIDAKCCIRLDVADYFNSIDTTMLMATLPSVVTDDEPLMYLLTAVLDRADVIRAGSLTTSPQRGVMAGSALSCMLSNFYLKDLDDHFHGAGLTYARYSDDIILFASRSEAPQHERFIREHVAAKGLSVNEAKSQVIEPGEPWEYLGLRFHRGVIDLTYHTALKFKARVRRLARSYARSHLSPTATVADLIQQLNRRCYGLGADKGQFAWSVWFFPVLTSAATLKALDQYTQSAIRYAVTRTRSGRSHKLLPYGTLRALGYIPLTMAYFTFKRSPQLYHTMLARRAGQMAAHGGVQG